MARRLNGRIPFPLPSFLRELLLSRYKLNSLCWPEKALSTIYCHTELPNRWFCNLQDRVMEMLEDNSEGLCLIAAVGTSNNSGQRELMLWAFSLLSLNWRKRVSVPWYKQPIAQYCTESPAKIPPFAYFQNTVVSMQVLTTGSAVLSLSEPCVLPKVYILWQVDPLLDNDLEIDNYITAVVK